MFTACFSETQKNNRAPTMQDLWLSSRKQSRRPFVVFTPQNPWDQSIDVCNNGRLRVNRLVSNTTGEETSTTTIYTKLHKWQTKERKTHLDPSGRRFLQVLHLRRESPVWLLSPCDGDRPDVTDSVDQDERRKRSPLKIDAQWELRGNRCNRLGCLHTAPRRSTNLTTSRLKDGRTLTFLCDLCHSFSL